MGNFSSPVLNDQRGPRDHSWPYKTKAITAQCLWSRLTRYPSVTIQRSTNLATHSVPFASFAATTVWHKAHLVFFLWRLLMVAGWRMSLDFDWKKMLLEVSLCPYQDPKLVPTSDFFTLKHQLNSRGTHETIAIQRAKFGSALCASSTCQKVFAITGGRWACWFPWKFRRLGMDNIKRILAFFLWFQTILDRLRQLHHKKKLGIEIVGP